MTAETKIKIGKSKQKISDEKALYIYNECIRLQKEPYGIAYKTTLSRFEMRDWTKLKARVARQGVVYQFANVSKMIEEK